MGNFWAVGVGNFSTVETTSKANEVESDCYVTATMVSARNHLKLDKKLHLLVNINGVAAIPPTFGNQQGGGVIHTSIGVPYNNIVGRSCSCVDSQNPPVTADSNTVLELSRYMVHNTYSKNYDFNRFCSRIIEECRNNGSKRVIAARMGLGKTEAIIGTTQYYYHKHPEQKILIVKGRKDDLRVIRDRLEGIKDTVLYIGFDKKECIKKANDTTNPCRFCDEYCCSCNPEYRNSLIDDSRVVLMTHDMFFQLVNSNRLSSFFKNTKLMIFIDEKPILNNRKQITKSKIDKIIDSIDSSNLEDVVNCIREVAEILVEVAKEVPKNKTMILTKDTFKKKITIKHLDAWRKYYRGSYYYSIFILRSITRHGCLITTDLKQNCTITTSEKINYDSVKHPIIVFDGSAKFEPLYTLLNDFQIETFDDGYIYDDLEFVLFNKQRNKGINDERESKINEIVENVERINAAVPNQKILIVTTVNWEKEILERCGDNVTVVHYNALRGRNDLSKYSILYFTHILQMPSDQYISDTHLIFSDYSYSPQRVQKRFSNQITRFQDLRIEYVRVMSIVAELIQDICRGSIRNKKKQKVFIGLTDMSLVWQMMRYFKGAKFNIFSDQSKGDSD